MLCVAGCKCGVLRQRDTRDLVSRNSTGRPNLCREPIRSLARSAAAASNERTRRHDAQSNSNFENRNGCGSDRDPRLFIKPRDHASIGSPEHERRKYVRVQDDHRSNDAGLISYPRSSEIPDSSPALENNEDISVPNPPAWVSSSLTALRRISRISSSMLWPCFLARRCSFSLTELSMFSYHKLRH